MTNDSLFTKNEISEILKKASEIQAKKDLYGDKEGLTKQELIQLASEVGIDKESLLEAIEHKNIQQTDNTFNWIRGTASLKNIELVEGEITDEQWDVIIREIRSVIGGIGRDSNTRTSYEWEQRLKDIGYRHISLTPQNGKTRIQYAYKWSGIKFISMFIAFMAGFTITAVSFDGSAIPLPLSLIIAFIVGSAATFLNRLLLKPYFEKQKKLMDDLFVALRKKLKPSSTRIHIVEEVHSEIDQIEHIQQRAKE